MNQNSTRALRLVMPFAGPVAIVLALVSNSPRAGAQTNPDAFRIQQGLSIAPVPLNMTGLDPNLVGLGSYFVNAVGDCNGCHSAGPQTEYPQGKNPYFNQVPQVNPATYLGGGRDFGALIPNSAHIISRNLTPDKTGMAEGGHTFSEFRQIMRTGVDLDHLHPTCAAAPTANCIPAPFNGNLLQIMPWPTLANLSDSDLLAIYTYLSAIPCIAGPSDPTDPLHNDCPAPTPPSSGTGGITIVVTGPNGSNSATNAFTVNSNQVGLTAAQSTSTNAGPLTYSWVTAPGYPIVAIAGSNTAAPTFQLALPQTYQFILTVTDATGLKATATITVTYI